MDQSERPVGDSSGDHENHENLDPAETNEVTEVVRDYNMGTGVVGTGQIMEDIVADKPVFYFNFF